MPDSDATGDDKVLFIGLTMAGAISAGAYTAGVLDILFRALDLHNARQKAGKTADWQGEFSDHPRHRVVLRVISGTSAGGVSAGLAMAGLIDHRRDGNAPDGTQIGEPVDVSHQSPQGYGYAYRHTLEPLHYCWVEALDLLRSDGQAVHGLLGTEDLKDGKLLSALNSDEILRAASTALQDITWAGAPYSFIASDLDIFLTTTNLQGLPYRVAFTRDVDFGPDNQHQMMHHAPVRHFRVSGMGEAAFTSDWLEAWNVTGIPLELPAAGQRVDFELQQPGATWRHFKAASIATGAFPIGLAAQVIEAEARDFGTLGDQDTARGGAWPVNLDPSLTLADGKPLFVRPKPSLDTDDPAFAVNYVAVDGGVANNEPYEYADYTLRTRVRHADDDPAHNFLDPLPNASEAVDRIVIMIDPFPGNSAYKQIDTETADLLRAMVPAAQRLVPSLINQARFKPSELIEASSPEVHSRTMILPSRRISRRDVNQQHLDHDDQRLQVRGAEAIASGAFGGFGGFFDQAFRAHDFMLGQRNAQIFLAGVFRLSARNPIFGLEAPDPNANLRVIDAGNEFYNDRLQLPDWPRIGMAQLNPILRQARERLGRFSGVFLKIDKRNRLMRGLGRAIWSADLPLVRGIGARADGWLHARALSELIRRDQLEEFRHFNTGEPYDDWQRQVLGRLAESGATPIPLSLTDSERARLEEKDEPSDDLISLMIGEDDTEESTAHKRDSLLLPFLNRMIDDGHVWQAPQRREGDLRFTLEMLKPSDRWLGSTTAAFSRLGHRLFP